MKLARPDIFHPRIVLAGCPQQVAGDGDDAGLVAALGQRGLHARWLSWDDPEVGGADLVILRATHDYAGRLDEFLAWTTGVANLLNAPAVVAWNADRRYLGDLAHRGVPTVGHSVFVQPGGPAAETALVFLGGEPSHAFTGALDASDALVADEPDFEIWDVGSAALAAAAAQVGIHPTELLYARAHVVSDPPRLRELQLVDPSLGWRRLDASTRDLAQREFALRVESALERLGLGPLSRRDSH
jgi:hypothetical protein